ncbi:MAG: DNA repair protein RecN [Treponema sp.]|jgi:DNA repair protein RecN (Recombination protein N)|nr:DNA repair protein RecN [Treponema sp.]
MLEELSVRNFALIDSLSLSLEDGFSVLTGETGAGKSIIVGTLSFLLGSRADAEVIRSGSDEATVSAVVSIDTHNHDALEWLKSREIEAEDSRLVIRRTVKSSGRSSIYIQNLPVSRNDLAEFMGFIVDLHGQHNHESLLKKETHRIYLDRFYGIEDEVAAFNRVFLELADKQKTIDALARSERDREGRLELLRYAVEEIAKTAPKRGEIKELEAETQRLGDFEKLSNHVNSAASALFDGDASLVSIARRLKAVLENAVSIDSSLTSTQKRLEDLYYEAEDMAGEFRSYRDKLCFDPGRLEEAEERLALLYKLKKKYQPAGEVTGIHEEDGILAYKAEAEVEIETLSGAGENQDKLKLEISRLEKDLASKAQILSAKRTEGAKRLGTGITDILFRLGMGKAVFSARVAAKSIGNSAAEKGLVCGPWGADDVEFLFSANKGEPLKELARIASGGELSRVMLAIKTILCGTADKNAKGGYAGAPTLVFDEIDTGIGGEVALSVGEYLARIGKGKQIFCVTHLASIASRADNHLRVEKRVMGERTVTGVSLLSGQGRRQEIARMLSGDYGDAALAHADELLSKYRAE